jgi:hypothetical protein
MLDVTGTKARIPKVPEHSHERHSPITAVPCQNIYVVRQGVMEPGSGASHDVDASVAQH